MLELIRFSTAKEVSEKAAKNNKPTILYAPGLFIILNTIYRRTMFIIKWAPLRGNPTINRFIPSGWHFTSYCKMGPFLYFGFSAQLSLVAKVSHCVLSGLFTTRKSPLFLSILTTSSIDNLDEI